MPTRTLTFAGFSNSGTVIPWQIGNSTPAYPEGYIQGGDAGKILSGAYTKFSGSGNSVLLDDTPLLGNVIAAAVTLGAVFTDAQGPCICSPSGTGYQFLINSTNIRCFAMSNFILGTQVGASIAFIVPSGHDVRVERNNTTGVMTVLTGPAGGSPTSRGSVTQVNANTDWRAGGFVRSAAAIAAITSDFTAAQTITSINSGNPIAVGQSGVVIAHTGFTGTATSVTTNRAGVTCTITAGDANSTTVSVSGWVEGGSYPVVDNAVTFTVSRSGESASATQTLTRPANWAQQTFAGAILDDQNLIGFNLAAAGHTVNGGAFYYRTNQVSSLTVNADTSWTSAPAGGTFDAVFIPSAGATAGNAYLFEITVLNGSIVVESGGGLTSIGLTAIGLGVIGLTAIGFGSSGQSGPTSLLFDDTQLLDSTDLGD